MKHNIKRDFKELKENLQKAQNNIDVPMELNGRQYCYVMREHLEKKGCIYGKDFSYGGNGFDHQYIKKLRSLSI